MSFILSRRSSLRASVHSLVNPVRIFMVSTMAINAGNYLYNLILGRILGPEAFAEVGIVLTILLLFSFLAMTFQLTATKYIARDNKEFALSITRTLKNWALFSGTVLALIFMLFSSKLAIFLNLSGSGALSGIILALPVYFIMSVDRGRLQGKEQFISLSGSYQVEFWIRSILTLILFSTGIFSSGTLVSNSIGISLLIGCLYSSGVTHKTDKSLPPSLKKEMVKFFAITAAYELTQIFINYSDVFAVKHYFDNFSSGLYTSTSLVGKMIYFLTWMLVMMLMPRMIRLRKEGKPYNFLFYQTLGGVGLFIVGLTLVNLLYGDEIVIILFGASYSQAGPLLWLYAIATGLFALSNIFVFYFISIDKYVPVFLSFIMAMMQLPLFQLYHSKLSDIIFVQITVMGILLVILAAYYLRYRQRRA